MILLLIMFVAVTNQVTQIKENMMLDNLAILALGGAVVCAIFVIAELIANWRKWK